MIVRPPEKKPSSSISDLSSFFSNVANDNRPPQKALFGWFLFMVGFLLLVGTFFWV